MIETLGYITLYLLVGVVLLPFQMLVLKDIHNDDKERSYLYQFVLLWPIALPFFFLLVLIFEWENFKDYK